MKMKSLSRVRLVAIPSTAAYQAPPSMGFPVEWGAIAFSRYVDDTTLMAESKEELKNFLMKVKEESDKAGLKLGIQKAKIMESGPIISWHIGGETMETVTDVIFLDSKIIADGDCSHKIKRHLFLGREVMTNLTCEKAETLLYRQRPV